MNIPLSEHFNNKKLMQFVLPSIIMMMFTSIYSVVDGFFISNCVGANALASVNLIMPVLMMVGAIGFILTPKIAVKLGAEGEILDGCIFTSCYLGDSIGVAPIIRLQLWSR